LPYILALTMSVLLCACADVPPGERGNDEGRYVTGSNIPRRSPVTSSDRVEQATTLDSGVGIGSPR